MTTRKILIGGVAGLAMVLFARSVLAEEMKPSRKFMRQKLTYSQGVLEGATLANYSLMETNAVLLRNMNLTNAFSALGNRDYFQSVGDFQNDVDTLIAAAKTRNLEKSTEAYSAVMKSCIACHQMFRREQHLRANSN